MFDKSLIRLFVTDPLSKGARVTLGKAQSHYLVNVMRKNAGHSVALFNGVDGEWHAEIIQADKKATALDIAEQRRPQEIEPDVWLAFAPLKKDRTDIVIEKSTELGIAKVLPVQTAHTNTNRVNRDRLQATALESAEQCSRLGVPDVEDLRSFSDLIGQWPEERKMIFMDETGGGAPLFDVLSHIDGPIGFVIGPEGGFASDELDAMRNLPFSVAADLGPRILRAETATVAALAIRQAVDDQRRATLDKN